MVDYEDDQLQEGFDDDAGDAGGEEVSTRAAGSGSGSGSGCSS